MRVLGRADCPRLAMGRVRRRHDEPPLRDGSIRALLQEGTLSPTLALDLSGPPVFRERRDLLAEDIDELLQQRGSIICAPDRPELGRGVQLA